MNELTRIIAAIEGWVYRPYAIPLMLLVVGIWLTYRTGFVQIVRFPIALRMVMRGAFAKDKAAGSTITPFQALSTALAATVGNGNIGGVATAILLGGPGAVFWMWMTATVGMATKYAEAVLGVHYRVRRASGELASGPMYYIARGLPNGGAGKKLAVMFAIFGAAAALLGTGNMAQSNTVARTFVEASRTILGLEVGYWVPGLFTMVTVGLVLLGGIKRIAQVTEKLVPGMIVIYVVTTLAFILMHADRLPAALALIVSEAFTPAAAAGGFIGASVAQGIAAGVSRGVLSNEAGLGSAPIAHGIANVKHPAEQGVVGVFEVFTDTIVVCTMTAFVIIEAGLWTAPEMQGASGDLTAASLSTSIPFASAIVALSSFLFGYSTLLGWSYYGEKCIEYLLGPRVVIPYRIVFTILIFVGAVISVPLVWAVGTLLNAFMAFPNLIALLFLGGTVARLTKDYFSGRLEHATKSLEETPLV
jgi:AGCS family alanine or glycine:cation symporter